MSFSFSSGVEHKERNVYIDMLRGVSILLVMLLHYSLAYRLPTSLLQQWIPFQTLRTLCYNGNYGVCIFFVISGFLITSNILKRYGSLHKVDVIHFYKFRFFRLYPLVVVALAVITILGLVGLSKFANISHKQEIGNWFFVIADFSVLTFWHNILMEFMGYFNYAMNIYWSLSVEEVFYLLYPLALVVLRRRWQLVLLAISFLIIAPVYRDIYKDNELFYMYGNLACVDMLTYGCIAAVVVRHLRLNNVTGGIFAVLATFALGWVYMRGIRGNEALGATFIGIASATFLISVFRLPVSKFLRLFSAPLAWLGSRSYELYLFHIVVLGIIVELIPRSAMPIGHKIPIFALFVLLSALLAWLFAKLYGDPLNRILRRRFASRKMRAVDPMGVEVSSKIRLEAQ